MKFLKKYGWIFTGLIGIFIGFLIFQSPENSGSSSETTSAKQEMWTCSMHPQIMAVESGSCPICGMDLIPVHDNGTGHTGTIKMSPTAMQLAGVQTAEVELKGTTKSIRLNGTVEVDERYINTQTAHISGRIEKLLINFTGETVAQGQVLATVYSPDLVQAQNELFEAELLKDVYPELFQSAKAKLKYWKLRDDDIDAILKSGKPKEYFPIRANVKGVVTDKLVNMGDHVDVGQPLFEVSDLSRVWVMFDVYERDMALVKRGNRIEYSFQSLPGESFSGIIEYIDPIVNTTTRVSKARVLLPNIGKIIKPGMFVSGKVDVKIGSGKKQITVPKSAVLWTGERSVVYVKVPEENGGGFVLRRVVLGQNLGESFIIKSGLEVGEEIVVNGAFSVDAAAQLSGQPSMMNEVGGRTNTGHNHGDDYPGTGDKSNGVQQDAVVGAYLKLKDALVGDDFKSAQTEGTVLMNAWKKNRSTLTKSSSLTAALTKSITAFNGSKDIIEAREHFIDLSESMISLVKAAGVANNLFIQHCPMVNNNKGANWLSDQSLVRNPYFGKSMLTCGKSTAL